MNMIATEIVPMPEKILPTYDANDLTKGDNLARIVLHDQAYTLRITRAGKLILTK